jgi:O-methyltransferase involved in polyketide biosynthesis
MKELFQEKDKIQIKLDGVQETLVLPLWGRAIESIKPNPIIEDHKALEFIKKIDYDWNKIGSGYNDDGALSYIFRAKSLDDAILTYINKHPNATIVNIGAGLDTTFTRVDNGKILWYDLDLPEVISLRSKLMKETNRMKFISKSVLDFSWFNNITFNKDDGIFFTAGGVYHYFNEEDIKKLFCAMAESFPGGEHVFDIVSKFGKFLSNRMVKKAGNTGAPMNWHVKNAEKIAKWHNKIQILEEYSYYSKIQRSNLLESSMIWKMNMCDKLKAAKYIHIYFKKA